MSLISPNGYNMANDQGSMWGTQTLESFEQPMRSDQMVIHPPEEMSICDMEAEYGLRNLQNLDASLMNSQCFDFGFGDYSPTVMPSFLYGDMTSPMDHVAWDNC